MQEADDVTDPQDRCDAAAPQNRSLARGIVIAVAHGFVEVHTDQGTLLCTLRGRLRRARPAPSTAPVAAGRRQVRRGSASASHASAPTTEDDETPVRIVPGDHVIVRPLGGDSGVVEELSPRRSALTRSAGEAGGGQVMLANLDHAVLVFAVRDPAPHFGMLDRYLALCEHAGVDVTICLNKVDLGVSAEVAAAAALYESLGYHVLETSALNGEHVAILSQRLRGRVSLLSGPSGVGKSSLVNVLLPEARQRISAVSETTGKGRHTTTGARLLPLPHDGWLADSAGIRELALWKVPADELPRCFVELREVADECLYADCEHGEDEEGCALREALAAGRISPSRYASFERLLREARGEV